MIFMHSTFNHGRREARTKAKNSPIVNDTHGNDVAIYVFDR